MSPSNPRSGPTSHHSLPSSPHAVNTDSFRDRREVRIRTTTYVDGVSDADRASLMEMYSDWPPENRTLGLPPREQPAFERWIDRITDGVNVLAWHEDQLVGHAALSPDEPDESGDLDEVAHELLTFVDATYQGAGIGSMVLSAALAFYAEHGGGQVRLRVARANEPALGLFEKFGFETVDETAMALEMARDVHPIEHDCD